MSSRSPTSRCPSGRAGRLRDVTSLADSIAQINLIEPIVVRRIPGQRGFLLISGQHRLEAHRQLGRTTILARVVRVSDLQADLMEIDENLVRNEPTALERGELLLRRKDVYEQLHPEVKHGGAPGKKGGGKQAKDATVASFATNTSERTGLSIRTIQDDVKVARLSDDTKQAIRGTPVQKRMLLQLTRVAPEQQTAVAEAVASGRCRTVQQAGVELGVKDKLQRRHQHGDIKARVHGVVDPLSEVKKRWERLATGLDSSSGPEAKAIEEEIVALEEKIHAIVRSLEARSAATALPNDTRPMPSEARTATSGDRSPPVVERKPSSGTVSEEPTIMLLSEEGFDEAVKVVQAFEQVTRIALDAFLMISDDDPRVIASWTRLHETLMKSFDELDQLRDLIDGKHSYDDYLREHGVNPPTNDNEEGASRRSKANVRARYSLNEVIAKRRPPPALKPPRESPRPPTIAGPPPRSLQALPAAAWAPHRTAQVPQAGPAAASATALSEMPPEAPTPEAFELELTQILEDYMSGRMRRPFEVEAAILKKNWPRRLKDTAIERLRGVFAKRHVSTPVPALESAMVGYKLGAKS